MVAARKRMKGALCGFLGTFTSRYSDYRGYWVHGQFLPGMPEWTVDLLDSEPSGDGPQSSAERLAIRRFEEQVLKAGLSLDVVRSARLHVTRDARPHTWRFHAGVTMRSGHAVEREQTLIVREHHPGREIRRARTDWGS